MKSSFSLSIEERDSIYNSLTFEQKSFLDDEMIRSRRTVFAQKMAKAKGFMIPDGATSEEVEKLLDGWIYTGYIDAGKVSKEHPCHCGRALRYQHKVEDKITGAVLYFSEEHLGEHLGLDAETVALVVKGFDILDGEMNEILYKCREGWNLGDFISLPLPSEMILPKDIRSRFELDLPLLERQLEKLRKKTREFANGFTKKSLAQIPNVYKKIGIDKSFMNTEDEQASFNFFDNEQRSSHTNINQSQSHMHKGYETVLREQFKPIVRKHLMNGVQSVRILSELLLKEESMVDYRRYSTGKPNIFVPISIFIDTELVSTGLCRLVSKDTIDRLYEWL